MTGSDYPIRKVVLSSLDGPHKPSEEVYLPHFRSSQQLFLQFRLLTQLESSRPRRRKEERWCCLVIKLQLKLQVRLVIHHHHPPPPLHIFEREGRGKEGSATGERTLLNAGMRLLHTSHYTLQYLVE
jgi:hypothetical protein